MTDRGKWAFWAVVMGVFLAICLPSAYFVDALGRYRRFFSDMDATSLRPERVRFVPHRDGRRGIDPNAPVGFADFSLKAAKAKTVALIGDFNGWKDSGLKLSRVPGGRWQILVPLAKGRHGYLFVVDGSTVVDPGNRDAAQIDGRKASVRLVQ